jgi:hypothetical protein
LKSNKYIQKINNLIMTFIPVTADPCNVQGLTNQGTPRATLRLHKDLIGVVNGQEIYPRGGNILNAGGHYYTNIRLAQNTNLDNV